MATLSKKDIRDIFVLLAIVFLLDSIPSGYAIPLGIVVFIIVLAIVWLGTSDYEKSIERAVKAIDSEIVLRTSIILTFLGVLLHNAPLIALGFLIGEILIFGSHETLEIDLWGLKVRHKK